MAEGERLIAFEAAIQELASIQQAAARYRSLRARAEALLGELADLGRTLRQAKRRGVFTDAVADDAIDRVRMMRQTWLGHLEALRSSQAYRDAQEAFAANDQKTLREIIPTLFADMQAADVSPPIFRALELTSHRRASASPFRSPAAVAADVETLRRDGLFPRLHRGEWWDTDLPSLIFARSLEAIESPAALSFDSLPLPTACFSEDESIVIFAPLLVANCSVVVAKSSDNAWYEAAEGSYPEYRDALVTELGQRSIAVRVVSAWS